MCIVQTVQEVRQNVRNPKVHSARWKMEKRTSE